MKYGVVGWEISSSHIIHYWVGVGGEFQLLSVAVAFKELLKSDCEMFKCMQCVYVLLRRIFTECLFFE